MTTIHILSPSGVISEKFFPIIRYAEILLAYSEALNNLQVSHSIELTMPNGETKTYTETDLNQNQKEHLTKSDIV